MDTSITPQTMEAVGATLRRLGWKEEEEQGFSDFYYGRELHIFFRHPLPWRQRVCSKQAGRQNYSGPSPGKKKEKKKKDGVGWLICQSGSNAGSWQNKPTKRERGYIDAKNYETTTDIVHNSY